MEKKWSHIKFLFKTTENRKRVEDRNRNKEYGQQIGNNTKYDKY